MKIILKKWTIVLLLIIGATLFTMAINRQTNRISLTRDYVPDKETAVKIAEAIWLPIYGKVIYHYKPFNAELKNDSVWVVRGTKRYQKGKPPYMEIQKSDCKILKASMAK